MFVRTLWLIHKLVLIKLLKIYQKGYMQECFNMGIIRIPRVKLSFSFAKTLRIVFFLFFFTLLIKIQAQTTCDPGILQEAIKRYNKGDFDYLLRDNQSCLESGYRQTQQKITALRLLSLSAYAVDLLDLSKEYAASIVEVDQSYSPDFFDPIFFKNAVNDAKRKSSANLVTSVSKKAENIELAPATVVALSEKTLKNRGYNDLESVLHDLSGFDISRSNGLLYSHIYQRGVRQSNTSRTLLLFDGVEENDLWSFNAFISRQFAMSNIKHVEVVYGPSSTIYGANAFLGVIDVRTKDPEDYIEDDKFFGFEGQVGTGTYNTKFFDGTLAMKAKNFPISFSITGRVFESDEQDLSNFDNWNFENGTTEQDYINRLAIDSESGIESFFNSVSEPHPYYEVVTQGSDTVGVGLTSEGARKAKELDGVYYDDPKTKFSDFTHAYSLNTKIRLYDLLITYQMWTKDEEAGAWFNDVRQAGGAYGENWSPRHQFFSIKYDKKITPSFTFSNFLRYKIHDFDKDTKLVSTSTYWNGRRSFVDLLDDKGVSFGDFFFYQNSKQLRNEFKLIYFPFDGLDFIGGLELRFSSIQGDYYTSSVGNPEEEGELTLSDTPLGGNQFNSRDIGVYIQSSYKPLDILSLTLGGRLDNNKIRQHGGYGSVLNWRGSLVLSPNNYVFKLIYATAFLDADSRARFSTVAGQRELANPNLQPERVANLELSVGSNFLDKKLKANISAYSARYENLIQSLNVDVPATPERPAFQTEQNNNVGEQQVNGIQAHINYDLNEDISFYGNYTQTNSFIINPVNENNEHVLDDNGNILDKLKVGDIANNRINIGANYAFLDRFNVNLRANYVGKRETGPGTNVPKNSYTFDPYTVLFATISYQPFQKDYITLQINVNNILDEEYSSPGIRDASNTRFSSFLPQNRRNIMFKLLIDF